jgi:hypothetical protein
MYDFATYCRLRKLHGRAAKKQTRRDGNGNCAVKMGKRTDFRNLKTWANLHQTTKVRRDFYKYRLINTHNIL